MSLTGENIKNDVLVSVVIATHGRPDQLVECLRHLGQQSFKSFEIVIVDDATPVPIALSQKMENLSITLIRISEQSGPGGARNAGVAQAKGKLIAFTDDDCLPAPGWIEQLWAAHIDNPAALLGGKLYNAVPEYLGAEASQVISDIVYAWYNSDAANARFFSTNNLAVPRAEFLEIGGFNAAFKGASEDRDLCDRWRASGRRMQFVPDAVIGHAHRLTVKKFTRQHFGYGRGAAVFHDNRAQRGAGSIVDEMPFHRALPRLAWTRLSQEKPTRKVSLLAMIGLWQVANAAGYAWERMRGRK